MSYILDRIELSDQELKRLERSRNSIASYHIAYICKNCGAEMFSQFEYIISDQNTLSALSRAEYEAGETYRSENYRASYAREARRLKKILETKSIAKDAVQNAADNSYTCPVCGAELSKEKGFFCPDFHGSKLYFSEYESRYGIPHYVGWRPAELMEALQSARELIDKTCADEQVKTYSQSCDISNSEGNAEKAAEIKQDAELLKTHVFHLLHLESNIYFLGQRLSALYYQRILNNRAVIFDVHDPVYNCRIKAEKLRDEYQNALSALKKAEAYTPKVSVDYPEEPAKPVLGEPGLFNKKKVLAENETLTAQYQAAMKAYQEEVRRCDDEKARLITEKRAVALGNAQEKAAAAKAELDAAENSLTSEIMKQKDGFVPAKAVSTVLDKEITEIEELLKKAIATRNELYAYNIVFEKYRNMVALATFYEYLMSGRCSSLEGADGAYNIYENEIRANLIIAKLDEIVKALERIEQNQYTMYTEMCNIHNALDNLNSTLTTAVNSLHNIETNTNQTNEYLEHISQNSDMIAYNAAVTAHYSKVTAELTNAIGYMIALK